jgi:hypothetical protein
MVPAGEPWLEMEGTLVSRNFRRSVLDALLVASYVPAAVGALMKSLLRHTPVM